MQGIRRFQHAKRPKRRSFRTRVKSRSCMLLHVKLNDIQKNNEFLDEIKQKQTQTCILLHRFNKAAQSSSEEGAKNPRG